MIAWTWLRQATAAARALDARGGAAGGAGDAARQFYSGKLHTAAFFFEHELPKTEAMAALLLSLNTTVSEMRPAWF